MPGASEFSKRLAALATSPKGGTSFAPLAVLTVRFDGKGLKHVGKALQQAVDRYAALAPLPPWLFGFHPLKGAKKSRRLEQSKDLSTPGGREYLTAALDNVRGIPRDDPGSLNLVLKDGAKPWGTPGFEAPERGALVLAVDEADDPWIPGGFFQAAFPLEDLDHEERRASWLAFGDEVFTLLRGGVGWLTPAMWTIPKTLLNGISHQFPDDGVLELFAVHPQVDLPLYHSGNYMIFPKKLQPGPMEGLLAPYWATWLSKPLTKSVSKWPGPKTALSGGGVRLLVEEEPPLAMDEARHSRYVQARTALGSRIQTYPQEGYVPPAFPFFLARFAGGPYKGALARMKAAIAKDEADALARTKVRDRFEALSKSDPREALAFARTCAEIVGIWDILEVVVALGALGPVDPAEAKHWLSLCGVEERHSQPHYYAAIVAWRLGDAAAALAQVGWAVEHNRGESNFLTRLRKEPALGKLRKDPRFLKLVR